MHVGAKSLRSARSVLVAPPPCEACAAGQGVQPSPGKACWARRCIAANRVRRASEAAVRSMPVQLWGEACHPSTRTGRAAATRRIEAPPPSLLRRAAADAQFVRSFSSNWSADKPQCRG